MLQKATLIGVMTILTGAVGYALLAEEGGPRPARVEAADVSLLNRESLADRLDRGRQASASAPRPASASESRHAAPSAEDTVRQPLAAPGGAASKPTGPMATLWLDGDAYAALPIELEQQLASGRHGVRMQIALTSVRSAGEQVASHKGDIGVVSRSKPGAARRLSNGERPLGTWLPALLTHPDNPVRNIPSRKLRDILRGKIRNWSELRGPDAEIRLILPADDDARAMLARALIPGDSLGTGQAVLTEERRIGVAVSDLYALTVVSLAAAERAEAKPLRIDGIEPSLSGRRRGTYPFGIDLVLLDGRDRTEEAHRAVQLLTGPDAGQLLGTRLSLP